MSNSNQAAPQESWWVYLIRNRNNALYCGVTNDLKRRFNMHQSGKGAKALRGKGPLTLEWSQELSDKSSAMKLEYRIKQLSKRQKEQIVALARLPSKLIGEPVKFR